jgi:hypothetical protein
MEIKPTLADAALKKEVMNQLVLENAVSLYRILRHLP